VKLTASGAAPLVTLAEDDAAGRVETTTEAVAVAVAALASVTVSVAIYEPATL
jgi:hypothetical protein